MEPNNTDAAKSGDTTLEPWYQYKNITPNVGRLMEALDRGLSVGSASPEKVEIHRPGVSS